MKNNTGRKISNTYMVVLGLVLFVSACTHRYDVPTKPVVTTGASAESKIDAEVDLIITKDLVREEWKRSRLGDEFIIPIGPSLRSNAIAITKDVFRLVNVVEPEMVSTNKDNPQVQLSLAEIDRSAGTWAFSDQLVTIILEWNITDHCGSTLWLRNIRGEGRANTGNAFTHQSETTEAVEKALRNVFNASRTAMIGSESVKGLAKQAADHTESAECGKEGRALPTQ